MKSPRNSLGFYLGYFAWVPFAAALYGGYLAYGLPHVIWAYEWREYAGGTQRYYLTCTHLGPNGAFQLPAKAGKCSWIIFRKADKRSASS